MPSKRKLINKLALEELKKLQERCNKLSFNFVPGLELINDKEMFVVKEYSFVNDKKILVKELFGNNFEEINDVLTYYLMSKLS